MALSSLIFICCVLFFNRVCQLSANHCQGYTTIRDVRRSTANVFDRKSGDRLLCDRNFIKGGTWYRFQSLAGNQMPTTNPGFWHCGTYAPIWLKGSHPKVGEGVVDRKACVSLPFVFPIGCGISYKIKVVNCGDFYLYQLWEPGQCSLAYCAGSKLPTDCSTTGETLPVCSGIVPNVEKIQAGIKEEANPMVRLKCVWGYKGNSKNVEFHVRWFGDEQDAEPKIQRMLDGTAKKEYLLEYAWSDGFKFNKNGYEFGKQVFCQVRAKFKGGDWSKWISSNNIFTGIAVNPQTFGMEECGNKKREVIVTLRPHLPIRGLPLLIDIWSPKSSLIDSICVRGENDLFNQCGVKLTSKHSIDLPMRIKLVATCSLVDPKVTEKRVDFVLGYTRKNPLKSNAFWSSYKFPTIKIIERKNKKRECYSVTDPHFRTFDGRSFDFMGRGTFVLYRNRLFGTEIQTRQKACGGGFASCNCGVAIKENAFYKIYDMCFEDSSQAWWKGLVRVRKRHLRDFKLNGFYTTEKSEGSTTIYEVSLPSGVVVTIKRAYWGLSTYVRAPVPSDRTQLSEGLCGNNNGNSGDDFNGKSASNFAESWRIRARKTIFDYEGDKFEEERIDDGCKQEICICERDAQKAICGRQAIEKCFPTVLTDHHTDADIGLCKNRKKRALPSRDDTIDDQDTIPAFDPPNDTIALVPKWPTPKGLTEINVTSFCNKKLRNSQAGETCGKVTGVDLDTLVQQCITDIQITEDFSWAIDNFAALEKTCMTNVYKNLSFYKNSTDGNLELSTEILASLCPNDCSDHGTCVNSTCNCDQDYTSKDCSISLKDRPVVFGIKKFGLCDVRIRPCRNVRIYGFPFLDSENLTCHIREYKVIDSVWMPKDSISLYPGLLTDLTEVKCTLPESPVNIGDYENEGVTAAGLKIAVSNNRINASEASLSFISYDSVCQECNTTTGCKLKTEACLISGHCFSQNESNPDDWCQQCLPEVSSKSWTRRKENYPPIFRTSEILNAFHDVVLQVQLSADDPENRTITFTFEQDETANASLTSNGLFTWKPTTNDSSYFTFKVYDECGAYMILNATVMIKQCPCKNGGRCQSDDRYLDGSGKFLCSCKSGFNGSLCELDVDECVSSPCINGKCKNEKPGFSCLCDAGYSGILCDADINECLSSPCFVGVECYDRVNGFRCGACPKGYNGTGEICKRIDGKIDECIKSPNVCHKYASCSYRNGSYACQCTKGYSGDGMTNCTDIDECIESPDVCHQHAVCGNSDGSYSCKCATGYFGDGKVNCSDINECIRTPEVCHHYANCTNIDGSYSCQCAKGFSGNGKVNCTDVNECNESPDVCHQHAVCSNSEGFYSCECANGYFGDGKINCSDIDECIKTPEVCHHLANCINIDGSYSCQCAKGFSGNGKVNCTDINECSESPDVCHQHAVCSNSDGSYSCECATGYFGDGKINCSDIDECIRTPEVCHHHANCTNIDGSYSCQCSGGYSGDGKFNCSDINECIGTPDICHHHSNCTNIDGSYSCQCARGFSGNGKVNCTDINECGESPDVCHQHAVCSNSEGSYSCECANGYFGDGKINCSDIDECIRTLEVCHHHANCTNIDGSYSCKCARGFSGNGKVNCTDINECSESPDVCHQHAVCSNSDGSYSCECERGYFGDGKINCSDINECIRTPEVCHHYANCTNTEGSYSCQCARGYLGDGKASCTENIPPNFTIPLKVYAIQYKEFHIQIKAVDPEGQFLKYSLLPEGTINNAQLSRDGNLTMFVKNSGNVHIKVEDDLGGQNVINLKIIAIQCPCKNGGVCSKDKSSPYPTDPSAYACNCLAPFTGNLCEFRPNPCDKFPCFPGLNCSLTNSVSGYICEECPKLFDGDGRNCVLKTTAERHSLKIKMTLTNQEWKDEFTNKYSLLHKKLVSKVTKEIRKVYLGHDEFSYVTIIEFRRGSVVVECELMFTKNMENPLEPLRKAIKNGKLGDMTVKMKDLDKEDPDESETSLGNNKTVIIVVVIVAALLIVIASSFIYFRVRRKRTKRGVKLSHEEKEEDQMITEPTGLSSQSSGGKAESDPQEIKLITYKIPK